MTETTQTQPDQGGGVVLRIAGAALLVATGAIHLDLYLTGYRTIPTIGWLFLLQIIAAFALAIAVVVSRHWLASAAGAGFALSTLGGYLLSVWVGLFGFKEVRTTAGIVAGVVEVAAFVLLAAASLASLPASGQAGPAGQAADRLRAAAPLPARAALGLAVVALALVGVAGATAASAPPASTATGGLRAGTVAGVRVLTDSRGRTLYWFAPDSSTALKCYGSCAVYWPPVQGQAKAGAGLPGTFGTIKRTDGSLQETYNGRPLYTYIGDSAPGQAHGNNLNLNGGLWHEVKIAS